jgi:hypothetical protein
MGALPISADSARHSAPCEAPVMVDAGQFWCTGHGAEVSTEEITLRDVQSPLLLGTGVDVYFELGGLVAIETRAVVIRAEGRGVTLRFLDLHPDQAHALADFVAGRFHSSTRIRQRVLSS